MLTSIIIPVFNEEPWRLARAIESVLAQDAPTQTIIVFDHAQMPLMADAMPGTADQVLFLALGIDGRGPGMARNHGMALADGDCIGFLDSDDFFLPGKVRTLAPLALQHGAAFDNVASGYEVDDRETMNLAQTPMRDCRAGTWRLAVPDGTDGVQPFEFFAATESPLFGLFDRRAIGQTRFPEDYRPCEDVIFNLGLVGALGGAHFCAKPLHRHTVRRHSLSHGPNVGADLNAAYARAIAQVRAGQLPGGERLAVALETKQRIEVSALQRLESSRLAGALPGA